jgi:hypothetical protein
MQIATHQYLARAEGQPKPATAIERRPHPLHRPSESIDRMR